MLVGLSGFNFMDGAKVANLRQRWNFSIMVSILMLLMVFVSCEKNNNTNSDSNNDVLNSPNVMNAANVLYCDTKVDSVRVIFYDSERFLVFPIVASAKYENGGFILNLPEAVNIEQAFNIIPEGIFISDTAAKFLRAKVIAFDSNRREMGDFYLKDTNMDGQGYYAHYVYADRNLIITGDNGNIVYDCFFKKGWNILYDFFEYVQIPKKHYTTQKPPNTCFQWYASVMI